MHPESQEPAPTETQHLRLVADYSLITVADVGHGGIDGDLISAAYHGVSAGSSKAIVIKVAGNNLAVDVYTEVWRGAPQTPHDPGWSTPVEYQLDCPSGDIRVGAPTGEAIGISIAAGLYAVQLFHQGRADALTVALRRETLPADPAERRAELDRRGAGLEQYLLQFWPIPDS